MTEPARKVLLIGYGNPGRLDDGLGPALAAAFEAAEQPGLTVESNYQLSVEDAEAAGRHDVVIFADASVAGTEPFFFRRLEPHAELSFSSHSVSPAGVLALAHDLFSAPVRGYALGIRGYEFNEFGEALSQRARVNLAAAIEFLRQVLLDGNFCEVGSESDPALSESAAPSNEDT